MGRSVVNAECLAWFCLVTCDYSAEFRQKFGISVHLSITFLFLSHMVLRANIDWKGRSGHPPPTIFDTPVNALKLCC